jgi:hypothetical protein
VAGRKICNAKVRMKQVRHEFSANDYKNATKDYAQTWKTIDLILLSNVATSVIRSNIGVSRWYASRIRQGYRPHPRHWQALADLAGVMPDV